MKKALAQSERARVRGVQGVTPAVLVRRQPFIRLVGRLNRVHRWEEPSVHSIEARTSAAPEIASCEAALFPGRTAAEPVTTAGAFFMLLCGLVLLAPRHAGYMYCSDLHFVKIFWGSLVLASIE